MDETWIKRPKNNLNGQNRLHISKACSNAMTSGFWKLQGPTVLISRTAKEGIWLMSTCWKGLFNVTKSKWTVCAHLSVLVVSVEMQTLRHHQTSRHRWWLCVCPHMCIFPCCFYLDLVCVWFPFPPPVCQIWRTSVSDQQILYALSFPHLCCVCDWQTGQITALTHLPVFISLFSLRQKCPQLNSIGCTPASCVWTHRNRGLRRGSRRDPNSALIFWRNSCCEIQYEGTCVHV